MCNEFSSKAPLKNNNLTIASEYNEINTVQGIDTNIIVFN